MTIHSDWARILHEECPQAFTLTKPPMMMAAAKTTTTTPSSSRASLYQVGVIDGHLQLMRLDARMETWDCFIRNQFLKPIQEMFSYGCPRVVLCFDDYANVPLYKAMTQKSRTSKFEVKTFGPHEELPAQIPDDPMLYLMNRNFKLKLIDMLCRRIPQMLTLQRPEQEFLLDYKMVVCYQAAQLQPSSAGPFHLIPSPSLMTDMENMGESDVKFIRYVKKYGNALVHAIDGDYMTIALLYYTQNDILATNKIFIFRQFSVLSSSSVSAAGGGEKKSGKRKKGATGTGGQSKKTSQSKDRPEEEAADTDIESVTLEKKGATEGRKPAQKKCWVDMQLLYVCITRAMQQCGYGEAISAKTLEPFTDKDAVFTAVFLMLCAGTDFSRNLPLIGPKKIWEYLPDIALPAIQALRGGVNVNESMFLNLVVGKVYSIAYSRHHTQQALGTVVVVNNSAAQPRGESHHHMFFERVIHSLRSSKLSQGTKNRFPSVEQVRNTIKNLIWVTKYWLKDNGHVETPLKGEYGFSQDGEGKMNFEDLI